MSTDPPPAMVTATRPSPPHPPPREVASFLAVGGAGYLTDVVAFNWLRDQPVLGGENPICAKIVAVAVAMVVTYLGNRWLTWRRIPSTNRRREIALFAVFNLIGLLIAVFVLDVSHNVLGLTSRLADNISANVIGVGLGTAFRYWSYRRFVFAGSDVGPRAAGRARPRLPESRPARTPVAAESTRARAH